MYKWSITGQTLTCKSGLLNSTIKDLYTALLGAIPPSYLPKPISQGCTQHIRTQIPTFVSFQIKTLPENLLNKVVLFSSGSSRKQSMWRCWGLQAGVQGWDGDKDDKTPKGEIKKAHAESGYLQHHVCARLDWMQLNLSSNYYLILGQK